RNFAKVQIQFSNSRKKMSEHAFGWRARDVMCWDVGKVGVITNSLHRRHRSAEALRKVHNVGRGSEIPRQAVILVRLNMVGKIGQKLRGGTREPIDGLIGIADTEERCAAVSVDLLQKQDLPRGRILKFVNEHPL